MTPCWIAKAAAGVSRSSHSAAGSGRANARICGRITRTTTAVIAPALLRSSAPTARARTATRDSRSALPTTARGAAPSSSDRSGNAGGLKPLERSVSWASGNATAAATSPAANVTPPITRTFAASTCSRRGLAVNVVRIMPRLYSAVMKSAPSATMNRTPTQTPWKLIWTASPAVWSGAMSPWPVTVKAPAPVTFVLPGIGRAGPDAGRSGSSGSGAPTSVLVQDGSAALPRSSTWSKSAVAVAIPAVAEVPPKERRRVVCGGVATKRPARAAFGRSAGRTVATFVHSRPSGDS